jgi:hypothetical protein
MQKSRSVGLRGVVLSVSLGVLLWGVPLLADEIDDLPPPPESGDTGLTSIDDDFASSGAELPPPPADAFPADDELVDVPPAEDTPMADSSGVEQPAGEELPPLTAEEGFTTTDPAGNTIPSDLDSNGLAPNETELSDGGEPPLDFPSDELVDVPPAQTAEVPPLDWAPDAGPTEFSSSNELKNVSMGDRIKSKDLVLWLSLGPSYGTLTGKGSFNVVGTTGVSNTVGGLGYNVGLGGMLDETFLLQFNFTGTPKTKNSTVDNAMFGFGPRLGFLTLSGEFGVQQGPDPSSEGAQGRIFVLGARAGLDLVLKHTKDSRTSIGLAPEVYYITPQGTDGYDSMGVTVSLRIYGYDTAF